LSTSRWSVESFVSSAADRLRLRVSVDHRPRHRLAVDDFGPAPPVLHAEVLNTAGSVLINGAIQRGVAIQYLDEGYDQPAHRVGPHRLVPPERDTGNRHTIPGSPE